MERNKSYIFIPVVFVIIGLIMGYPTATARAQERCTKWGGKMESLQGVVQVRRAGETAWASAKPNETYCPGDTVRTREKSRAVLLLPNETYERLDQKTTVTFNGIEKDRISLLDLITGAYHFFSRTPRALKVATPFVNGTVEGTEFFVQVTPDHTLISVFQGSVLAENDAGSLSLASGESAIARAGEAPKTHITARPRDAVQWAIYYPAVIDYQPADFPGEEAWQTMVRKSIQHYRNGDLPAAFSSLDGVLEMVPDPGFYTYRAGLLLTVGRVDEASDDIEKSLLTDPAHSHAFALQSIIAVAQNRKDQALELASSSVSQDPDSSAAKVALSYALQANFQVQASLETLKEAVALSPENALAWARLSELWMSVGDLEKALESAQKGADLNPNLARTQTVLGFAFLAQIKIQDAKEAFEKAIELDQAAPLPRLGLGLAKIRDGDLEPGRRDIEIAVCLDPNNSLMRSYLGKAFFDEKRDTHSDNQFAIAKELDPNDPTPWFYDAIRKQTLNRPVEALHDLQKSIELNDNRAVYRSRLLLDEDLAARSASLGRIYNELGFQQLALVEGWKSVNADPSNYSAHRFLADSYSALPRHEIARVSELLQSQLLQPINTTPIQPSLAESDLLITEGAGPGDPAFNEFNPLFHRNRFALQASGLAGGNDTLGGEVVQSGVWNRTSYSIGAFHYETDGFRENNDQDRHIYNAFVQTSLSHRTSIQAEYRYEKSENGDLPLRFDPADTLIYMRESAEAHSMRFGFRHAFSPGSDLLGSFIYKDQEDNLYDKKTFADIDFHSQLEGFLTELQYLFRSERVSVTSGAGYFNQDDNLVKAYIPSPFPPEVDKYDTDHTNLYVYSLINYPESVVWTIGASGNFYKGGNLELDSDAVNPKFGFTWNLYPNTTLRGAVFRTLKRNFVSDQTIEPTQIAGFNQFFEGADATEAWRYGFAIDQRFSRNVYGGIEYSQRDLDVPYERFVLLPPPALPISTIEKGEWEERSARTYLYFTPHEWFAGSVEFQYERFERNEECVPGIKYAEIYRFPIGISFHHPTGFSVRLKATYINQKGEFRPQDSPTPVGPFIPGDDDFFVIDGSISYRLPGRFGKISLEAKNLFDESFKYYDTDPKSPFIQPESLVLLRVTMAF